MLHIWASKDCAVELMHFNVKAYARLTCEQLKASKT